MAEGKAAFVNDSYPAKERLLSGFAGGVLLVDVGGGTGHDLQRLHEAIGPHDGQLILQDTESVVATAMVQPPIETMAHDFFKPQPIRSNARDRNRRVSLTDSYVPRPKSILLEADLPRL